MLPFLGQCEVCAKVVHTYRALAGHLRHNSDSEHLNLKTRWLIWRSEYRVTLWCRKCGQPWEMRDPSCKDRKRCPSCDALRHELGKRGYEALPTICVVPRQLQTPSRVHWTPGDDISKDVVQGLKNGERVLDIMLRLGITYKVFRAIGEQALGADGYRDLTRGRKRVVAGTNLQRAHEEYRALSPKAKAQRLKRLFGGTCSLEKKLASQLRERGVTKFRFNQWQAVPIAGARVPREADLKLDLGDGRKVVVLCDGEAFHGPRTIYGDPQIKIAGDRLTALGFFGLGYSVVRYSESEIHSGVAVGHLCQVLERLQSYRQIYRNWCPAEEVAA